MMLLDDGNENVGRNCYPDLRLDCIFACAEEGLDSQMLLDPPEKEFDLPSASIKPSHCQRRDIEIVCQEAQPLSSLWIDEMNQTKLLGVVFERLNTGQYNGLIAPQSRAFVYWPRIQASIPSIAFASSDEKRRLLKKSIQSGEVEVATIEDVERTGFEWKEIQGVDIVNLASGHMHPARDVATQVEERVSFHRSLGLAKVSPGKEFQAKIDGRGIECVGGVCQFHVECIVGIQASSFSNQCLGKIGPDAPIATLVGMRQRVSTDGGPDTHVVELGRLRSQTTLDVPKALAVSQLRKGQAEKLIHAGEALDVAIAAVAGHTLGECLVRQEVHHLRENRSTGVHRPPPRPGEDGQAKISNRF